MRSALCRPLRGSFVLLAYPGLTPWVELLRPSGLFHLQRSLIGPRYVILANDQRRATNDLFVFLTKRLNLDVHTCRQIELHQRIHSLLRRLEDIEQTLVGTNLELFA